jgi:hypothetical protein
MENDKNEEEAKDIAKGGGGKTRIENKPKRRWLYSIRM